ncbi:hypothetical protein [Gloeothece verrucosa]|uniref:Uncharacterized protein n=1 Tax=Gloeothece verrucosa (strain PCC 7822) TaxID=497965 RepID=E0UAX7_GLOV7|nr:hypothetical protein [Gloeothece verrucosa]ADN15099.1 conserved hypothetical protein [Gloeothece verrucosa PCC 7822]
MATERWNDERLDELADTVEQTTHNVDLLVGAVNAFLERDRERAEESRQYKLDNDQRFNTLLEELRQYKLENDQRFNTLLQELRQYKLENDQRFNTLLEEVRFLIRQLGNNQNP